jgi:hypothetical protein
VVVIVAVQTRHVHCDPRSLREAVQAELQVADAEGAVGEVNDGAREGFVERTVGGAEAGEACGCVEGGFEGL